MIGTISITIFLESILVTGYAIWRKKPLIHLLISELLANLFTQPLLWLALISFPAHYLSTLFIMEFLIIGIESLIFYYYKYNRLFLGEALILSLFLNLASFFIGWLLAI
jgi:hypothetical protein